jgi:DNA-binding ferritin-like protein
MIYENINENLNKYLNRINILLTKFKKIHNYIIDF